MLTPAVWPGHQKDFFIAGWIFDECAQVQHLSPEALHGLNPPGGSRRLEWLLGRTALRQAAIDAGFPGEEIEIGISPSGAPVLHGSTWKASITHTKGAVLAAVASTWVGIDIERADRDVSRLSRTLLDTERSLAEDVGILPLLVAKESVAKATTHGLGGSLKRWPVISAESDNATRRLQVGTPHGTQVSCEITRWREFLVGIALIPELESTDAK